MRNLITPQLFPAANHFFNQRKALASAMTELPAEIRKVLDTPLAWFKENALRTPSTGESIVTEVAFVLDKSSSMNTGKSVTMEGFNTQLDRFREGAKEIGETRMTLTQFSDEVSVSYSSIPVDQAEPLTHENYRPAGYTALYDGVGDTIAALLRLPHIDSPSCATLVTIFTDGEENASSRYSPSVVSDLIQKLEATGRWTFALVGPKRGVQSLADLLAVSQSNVTGFVPESVDSRTQVMGAMAQASTSYMTSRSAGATQVRGLYQGDLSAD